MLEIKLKKAADFHKRKASGWVVVSNGKPSPDIASLALANNILREAIVQAIKDEAKTAAWSRLTDSMLNVWNAIGSDVNDIDSEMGTEGKVEMCYDADRLVLVGEDPTSQYYLQELFRLYGIEPVRKALAAKLLL